jgi:hypothetical protein
METKSKSQNGRLAAMLMRLKVTNSGDARMNANQCQPFFIFSNTIHQIKPQKSMRKTALDHG